jgi:hypothetical protein
LRHVAQIALGQLVAAQRLPATGKAGIAMQKRLRETAIVMQRDPVRIGNLGGCVKFHVG